MGQPLGWLARTLAQVGEKTGDVFEEAVAWFQRLGAWGYVAGVFVVLAWLIFALWCSSQRRERYPERAAALLD